VRLHGKVRATDDLDMGGHHILDWRHLSDIPQGGATNGQVLTWNGGVWSPQDATGGGGITEVYWGDIIDVPLAFPPEAHTHPLSALTQSGATPGQVATWNGTLSQWVPATSTSGGGVTSIIAGTGINVSTSVGAVTVTCDLTWSELASKPATFPPSTHTHTLADITDYASEVTTNIRRFSIEYVIDGVGAVLSSGVKGYVSVPADCTIVEAAMYADTSGSVTVLLASTDYSGHTGGYGDITGGHNLSLSSANKMHDTTLTDWTTTLAYDDLLRLSISGTPTNMTRLTVVLNCVKD